MLWNLIYSFYSKLCPAFHKAKPTLKLSTRHTQPHAALTTSALAPRGVSCPIHSHPGLENAMILHNSCSGINHFAATQLTGIFFFPFSTTCLLLAAAAAAANSPPGRDGPSQNDNWSFVPTYGSMVPWPPRRDDDQSGPWSLGGGCSHCCDSRQWANCFCSASAPQEGAVPMNFSAISMNFKSIESFQPWAAAVCVWMQEEGVRN